MEMLRAKQGDTLDALIWRDRGLGAANLGDVLTANPGLADLGPILPLGTLVAIPALSRPIVPDRDVIQLWS